MPIVEKIARAHFWKALRYLLVETVPSKISETDAKRAYNAVRKSGAPKAVLGVFLEASATGNLQVVDLADVYLQTIQTHPSMTPLCIEAIKFDPNCILRLANNAWEHPIHAAVKRQKYDITRRLLELGGDVHAVDSNGFTVLMMACGSSDLSTVHLLLSFGADPNESPVISSYEWLLNASWDSSPRFPRYASTKKASRSTKDSDDTIYLLCRSGFKPSLGHWLERTRALANISRDAGLALRLLTHEPRPL